MTLAVYAYEPIVQRYLLAAKNGGRRDILSLFGQQMAALLPLVESAPRSTVVWVPASHRGRRRRGYDQARVLARAVANATGRPIAPLLTRTGNDSQAGRARSGRLAGPAIFCRVARAPSHAIVVDDVVTTGASLAAAASALRASGCADVIGLCVASVA